MSSVEAAGVHADRIQTMQEYLMSINVDALTGSLFTGGVGAYKQVHGGKTNPAGEDFRTRTMNSKAAWIAWALASGWTTLKVVWPKADHAAPPTAKEVFDALKKQAGL